MLLNRASVPLLALAGLLALAPAAAHAQRSLPPLPGPRTVAAEPEAPRNAATGWLVLGGAAGAAVGIGGGALAGLAISCEGECRALAPVVGGLVGEVVLLPLGVHLANGRKGNYGLELLASAGIAGGAVLLEQVMTDASSYVGWLLPVGQLAAVVYIERRTAGGSAPRLTYSYSLSF